MNIKNEITVTPVSNGVIVNNEAICDSPTKCVMHVVNKQIGKLIGSNELPYGDKDLEKPYKITITIESV